METGEIQLHNKYIYNDINEWASAQCTELKRVMVNSDSPEQPKDSVKCQCIRGYAAAAMLRMLPGVLIFVGDVLSAIGHTLNLLRRTICRIVPGRSTARPKSHVKSHPQYAYKG